MGGRNRLTLRAAPAIDSLRMIQRASAMPKVRRLLGCPSRVSLGSFSEAARVFDPSLLLLEVISELSQQLVPLAKELETNPRRQSGRFF